MKTYKSSGYVLGYLWGGGLGFYPAREFEAQTKTALIKMNDEALNEGSLDSGMGFQSLKGAFLIIEEIETIIKDGKEYKGSDWSKKILGELTVQERNRAYDLIQYH